MPTSAHYVCLLNSREAKQIRKIGHIPHILRLTRSRFRKLKALDVLWLFVVEHATKKHDAFVCGKFVVRAVRKATEQKIDVINDALEDVPVTVVSLAKAKLQVNFSISDATCYGFKSSPWGGGHVKLNGVFWTGFRSGWRIDDFSSRELDKIWAKPGRHERAVILDEYLVPNSSVSRKCKNVKVLHAKSLPRDVRTQPNRKALVRRVSKGKPRPIPISHEQSESKVEVRIDRISKSPSRRLERLLLSSSEPDLILPKETIAEEIRTATFADLFRLSRQGKTAQLREMAADQLDRKLDALN